MNLRAESSKNVSCREIRGMSLHLHETQRFIRLGIHTLVVKLSRKARKQKHRFQWQGVISVQEGHKGNFERECLFIMWVEGTQVFTVLLTLCILHILCGIL